MSRELARRNVPHRFAEFEGGHEWMPASPGRGSARVPDGHGAAATGRATKEAEKQAAHYEHLMSGLIERLAPNGVP